MAKWDASSATHGDDPQAAALDGRVFQIVIEKQRLWPRRAAKRIVPQGPIVMPVEGGRSSLPGRLFGENDHAAAMGKVSEAESLNGGARRRPVCQAFHHRVLSETDANVCALVEGRRIMQVLVVVQAICLGAQLRDHLRRHDALYCTIPITQQLLANLSGDLRVRQHIAQAHCARELCPAPWIKERQAESLYKPGCRRTQ